MPSTTNPTRRRPLASGAGALALLLLAACGDDGTTDPPDELALTVAFSFAPVNDLNTMEIWVMSEDGDHRRQVTTLPGQDRAPAWSPDGEQIAFVHYTSLSSDPPTLMVVNADGTSPLAIHSGPAQLGEPAWSPEGDRLAIHYRTADGSASAIAIVGADGLTLASVAGTEGASTTRPSWSPSGDRLLFTRASSLWIVSAAGGTPVQIATSASGGRFSPDGTRIAAVTNDGIVTMSATGSDRRVVATREFTGGSVVGDVAWSRDGTRLMFFGAAGTGTGANYDLFTVPVEGGTPTNLTETLGQFEMEPDWR